MEAKKEEFDRISPEEIQEEETNSNPPTKDEYYQFAATEEEEKIDYANINEVEDAYLVEEIEVQMKNQKANSQKQSERSSKK